MRRRLALPRFEAPVRLVDDVGAAAAADHSAVPVARLQRLQAIANLHGRAPARVSCFRLSDWSIGPAAHLRTEGCQVKRPALRAGFAVVARWRSTFCCSSAASC